MPVAPGRRPVATPGMGRVGSSDVEHLGAGIMRPHRSAMSKSSRVVVWGSVDGSIDDWLGGQPGVNHAGSVIAGHIDGVLPSVFRRGMFYTFLCGVASPLDESKSG